MRMLFLAACTAVTSVLAACSPLGMLDAIVPDKGYEKVADIRYGELPRQALDLYLPKADRAAASPVVVFFYGGSWRDGQRSHYRFVGQALASRGIAVAVADYRVYPEVRFPAFVEDGAAAVAKLISLARAHKIDPDRLFLMGHSAGAHLAALLALDERYLRDAGVPQGSVAGLIGLAGPYAFNPLEYDTSRPVFLPARNDVARAQPVTRVGAGAPPALLLHGAADETVLPMNTEELTEALKRAGVTVETKDYPEIGHVRIVLGLAAPFQGTPPVVRDIVEFITPAKDATNAGN